MVIKVGILKISKNRNSNKCSIRRKNGGEYCLQNQPEACNVKLKLLIGRYLGILTVVKLYLFYSKVYYLF